MSNSRIEIPEIQYFNVHFQEFYILCGIFSLPYWIDLNCETKSDAQMFHTLSKWKRWKYVAQFYSYTCTRWHCSSDFFLLSYCFTTVKLKQFSYKIIIRTTNESNRSNFGNKRRKPCFNFQFNSIGTKA